MITISAPIEDHLLDSRGQRALRHGLAHNLRRGHVAAALDLPARLFIKRARRGQRAPAEIVDDLRVDVPERAINAQARARRRARHRAADALVYALASRVVRKL